MKTEIIEGIETYRPESYADSLELIRLDYYRYLGQRIKSPLKLWLKHFRDSGMGYLFYYRLSQHRKGLLFLYFRLRMEKYARKYGLQIPLDAHTGKGLYLGHGLCIVVNGSAVIGSNVNLSQFTTIGSLKATAALIEDGVYMGPSVCTVERIRIGRGAVIGAGAVVNRDVPVGKVAAGVPAKVIDSSLNYKPVNPVS